MADVSSADLGVAAVAAVDPTGQAADILALPSHLRDAVWRVDAASLSPIDAPSGLVVAGMGGSSVGGRLANAALGPRATKPIVLAADYTLPAWVDGSWLVFCSSYSGGTEETLAAYTAASEAGTQRLVATTGGELAERARADGVGVIPLPGGFQPRASVGYALVCALETAALCGAGPSLRDEIEAAAVLAEQLAAEWGPDGAEDSQAKALARDLHGTVPIVCGAGLASAVAYRWKTQVNENAKLPAFWSELPEADHNEIVGWPATPEVGRLAAVFLEDSDLHDRVAARVELTAELAGEGAATVARVSPRGETRLERLVSLVMLGDLVSLYLGVLRGADPEPVEPIDRLKAALAGR